MTIAEVPNANQNDLYDPEEDVRLRDSPPPEILRPKLAPTPSPPPEDPESEEESPPRSPSSAKPKAQRMPGPSQGDVVLLGLLGDGRALDVARTAGTEILRSASEDEEMTDTSQNGIIVMKHHSTNLAALAAGALAHTMPVPLDEQLLVGADVETALMPNGTGVEEVPKTQPTMKTELNTDDDMRHLSPSLPNVNGSHELAPIQGTSPKAEKVNGLTLPSISAQLGNLTHIAEGANSTEIVSNGSHQPSFSQSSQSPPQIARFQTRDTPGQTGNHSSPSVSPNENFRRELPSPGRGPLVAPAYYYGNPRRPSQPSDGISYALTPADYSSSATETPSTDQSSSTPGGIPAGIDRMSIDGITNPQIGGFQCSYSGCTSQPFQTQYLLNSHANVHSSNRPHYCPVKDCPRSEGGKGFKRKNEMIRHGLVHESPGYVCPYCLDREHKYPRPDNLQRHVRVHHVDKDKDDPLLRDVLAQRPEGPSRGRRRRGGNN